MSNDVRRALATGVAAGLVMVSGMVAAARHDDGTRPAAPAAAAASAGPSATATPTPSRGPRVVAKPPAKTPAASPTVKAPYPLPAPRTEPTGCPPPKRGGTFTPVKPWRPAKVVREADLPAALPALKRSPSLDAVRGKGMWTYIWDETEGGSAAAVVAKAKATGLDQIWVRTGSSKSGFYAAPELRALLPLAHAAGIKVVAWDFPYLYDPVADAARAKVTLDFSVAGHRIDAFSPDIESPSEGTQLTTKRLRVYLSRLQRAMGDRPLVSTVPHANDHWWKTYDYRTQVPYVDAFAVMAYWNCTEPGDEVERSIRRLGPLGKPLHMIGQTFDMGPYGGRVGDPRGREVWRFTDVTHRAGLLGASFYVWQFTTREQFAALAAYPWD